ncbi:MAG: c-type cytochrome domain-containing protein [Minicystis sp.]
MIRLLHHTLALALLVGGGGCTALDPQFGALATGSESDMGQGGGGGDADTHVRFGRDIRPIFERSIQDPSGPGCKDCHYRTQSMHVGYDLGGLDLSTLGGLRQGGATSGTAILVAGDPDASVIIQKLEGTYGFGARMPRSGPPYLSSAEIGLVRRWISEGAKGADSE